jgi:uncharacterized protein (DUF2236 family)
MSQLDEVQRVDLGPDSLLWRYAGDTRIALMGASIGILQLMHPAIGAGVLDHSNFFDDPTDRIFRSLPRILGAVYDGDGDATGLEVRDFHRDIKGNTQDGDRYHALDPATFWWAHATFQYMAEGVADRYDAHRLTRAEREQLYAEGVEWYRRYGVSERAVPADRRAYQAEFDRVCAEDLEMNDAVRFVLRVLDQRVLVPFDERAEMPAWLLPLANLLPVRFVAARASRVVAIGGLPPVVRERFDIRWTRRDAFDLALIQRAVRLGWRFVPASVRWQPRAADGWRRTTGRLP